MSVRLHPLVLINICDHYERHNEELRRRTEVESGRLQVEEDGEKEYAFPGAPVCGALFGLQSGQKVDIFMSIECKILKKSSSVDPDMPGETGSPWLIDEVLTRKWVTMGA